MLEVDSFTCLEIGTTYHMFERTPPYAHSCFPERSSGEPTGKSLIKVRCSRYLMAIKGPPIVRTPLQGCQTVFSPLSLRSRKVAALINAKWLSAWGVLPRCRAWLSNSSAYRPSGLA